MALVKLALEDNTGVLILEGEGASLLESSGQDNSIIRGGLTAEPTPATGRALVLVADKLTAPSGFPGTAPEFAVFQALNRLGFENQFEFQSSKFGGRATRGGIVADFFVASLGLIINVQGEYWHYGRAGQVGQDLIQKQQIVSSGLTVVYIDEEDALANADFFVSDALRGIDHSKLVRGF